MSGVPMDWWAPPSGASVMPDGVAHQQEARVLVTGVVESVEAAHDEGVVERADRQETHAEERVRQPERCQQDEQVVLGDAELDMLALRRHHPALGRDHLLLG
jgi:hypothetical protein